MPERQSEKDFERLLLEFCDACGYQIKDNVLWVGLKRRKTKFTEAVESQLKQ